MRTWRGLYQLLESAGVDPRMCFFTNAYVGLIAGEKPTGRFPGAGDVEFSEWCADFLRLQIEAMQPSVLVTIGADARRFIGGMTPDLGEWRKTSSLRVHQARIGDHSFAGIALAHPSLYPASARGRVFEVEVGVAADAALLRAAVGRVDFA
jgi:uracil-DNA glycosylase